MYRKKKTVKFRVTISKQRERFRLSMILSLISRVRRLFLTRVTTSARRSTGCVRSGHRSAHLREYLRENHRVGVDEDEASETRARYSRGKSCRLVGGR